MEETDERIRTEGTPMSGPMALASASAALVAAIAVGLVVGGMAGVVAALAVMAAFPTILTSWEVASGGREAAPAALTYGGLTLILAGGAYLLA